MMARRPLRTSWQNTTCSWPVTLPSGDTGWAVPGAVPPAVPEPWDRPGPAGLGLAKTFVTVVTLLVPSASSSARVRDKRMPPGPVAAETAGPRRRFRGDGPAGLPARLPSPAGWRGLPGGLTFAGW